VRGGLSIAEVPVNHFPRAAGKATGANLGVVMKAFRELPIVWQYRNMEPWTNDRRVVKDPALAPWSKRRKAPTHIPAFLTEPLAAELPVPSMGEG